MSEQNYEEPQIKVIELTELDLAERSFAKIEGIKTEPEEGKEKSKNFEVEVPDKASYVEFRIMMKPFPNESWSDWLLYPCGEFSKNMRKALEKDGVLFVDTLDEAKDAIRVDTVMNAKFLDLPHDVVMVRQDPQQIKIDKGIAMWDKIPARFAPAIQIRLMDNNVSANMKPKTLIDIYEGMGYSATSSDEEEESDISTEETTEENP